MKLFKFLIIAIVALSFLTTSLWAQNKKFQQATTAAQKYVKKKNVLSEARMPLDERLQENLGAPGPKRASWRRQRGDQKETK